MTGTFDEIVNDLSILTPDFEPDGPEYLDLALLGRFEKGKAKSLLVAVNLEGANNDFSNNICLYLVAKSDLEYSFRCRTFENSCIRFPVADVSVAQIEELRSSKKVCINSDALVNPFYFSLLEVSLTDKTLQFLNECCRPSFFPVKKRSYELFAKVGAKELCEISRLESEIKKAPTKRLAQALSRYQSDYAHAYWSFFNNLFSDDTGSFIAAKNLGFSKLYPENLRGMPCISDMFKHDVSKECKTLLNKGIFSFLFGSYNSIDKNKLEGENSVRDNVSVFDVDDSDRDLTERLVENYSRSFNLGWSFATSMWTCGFVSYALIQGDSAYNNPTEVSNLLFFVPVAYFVGDVLARCTSSIVTDNKHNPGIFGLARSLCEYAVDKVKDLCFRD